MIYSVQNVTSLGYWVFIAIHYCTINGIETKESTQKGAAIMAISASFHFPCATEGFF